MLNALRPVQAAHSALSPAPAMDVVTVESSCRAVTRLSVMPDMASARKLWEGLYASGAATAFQNYEWLDTWVRTSVERSDVRIIAGHDNQRCIMILPMALERHRGANRLVWLGHQFSDYTGPLIDRSLLEHLTAKDVDNLLDDIARAIPEADYIYLAKQPDTLEGLPNPFARHRARPFTCSAHHARLSGNWKEFSLAHRSGKSLRRFREKERNLAKLGSMAFVCETDPQRCADLMDTLLDWKIAQLTARGDRVPFSRNETFSFLRQMARTSRPDGSFRMYGLMLDEEPVALAFCLVRAERMIYYLCGYGQAETARYSPGVLLLHKLFETALDEGLEIFDFSNGDEDYKAHWVDETEELFVTIRVQRMAGLIAATLDGLEIEIIRRIKRNARLRILAGGVLRRWNGWRLAASAEGKKR